jgi:hypothetical protein
MRKAKFIGALGNATRSGRYPVTNIRTRSHRRLSAARKESCLDRCRAQGPHLRGEKRNDPLFIFGVADGRPDLGPESHRPIRSIPSRRARPQRPVRKPSASLIPGTGPTPMRRLQFLTEIKSARKLRFPSARRRISTGPRSSFAELLAIAAGHAILVLNRTTRGRSTGCGRIYEDRFSMSCPPAST